VPLRKQLVKMHRSSRELSLWAKSPKKQFVGGILSAELAKKHSFRLFFGDFAHWDS